MEWSLQGVVNGLRRLTVRGQKSPPQWLSSFGPPHMFERWRGYFGDLLSRPPAVFSSSIDADVYTLLTSFGVSLQLKPWSQMPILNIICWRPFWKLPWPYGRSRNSTECTAFSVMILGIERHLLLLSQLEMNEKKHFHIYLNLHVQWW